MVIQSITKCLRKIRLNICTRQFSDIIHHEKPSINEICGSEEIIKDQSGKLTTGNINELYSNKSKFPQNSRFKFSSDENRFEEILSKHCLKYIQDPLVITNKIKIECNKPIYEDVLKEHLPAVNTYIYSIEDNQCILSWKKICLEHDNLISQVTNFTDPEIQYKISSAVYPLVDSQNRLRSINCVRTKAFPHIKDLIHLHKYFYNMVFNNFRVDGDTLILYPANTPCYMSILSDIFFLGSKKFAFSPYYEENETIECDSLIKPRNLRMRFNHDVCYYFKELYELFDSYDVQKVTVLKKDDCYEFDLLCLPCYFESLMYLNGSKFFNQEVNVRFSLESPKVTDK